VCTAGTNAIHGGVEETGTEPDVMRTIRMLTMEECCSPTYNGLSYRGAGATCLRCTGM